jgi:hypothetical protein
MTEDEIKVLIIFVICLTLLIALLLWGGWSGDVPQL